MTVAVTSEPGFEPTIDTSSANLSTTQDPALASGSEISDFTTQFGVANAEPIPVGYAGDFSGAAAAPALAPEPQLVEEIAVAAPPVVEEVAAPPVVDEVAYAAPTAPLPELPEPEPPPPDPLLQQMHEAVASMPLQSSPLEDTAQYLGPEPPMPQPEPPVATVAEEAHAQLAAELAAAISNAPLAAPEQHEASVASAFQSAPATVDPVSRAVERVLDRFKAELIAEIMRELKQ